MSSVLYSICFQLLYTQTVLVELWWRYNWAALQSCIGGWHWPTSPTSDETHGEEEDQAAFQDQVIHEGLQLQSPDANTVSQLSQFVYVCFVSIDKVVQ